MTDEFEPGPPSAEVMEPLSTVEEAPKRGPGRTRKDGSPPQPRTGARIGRPPKKRVTSLENELVAYLTLGNLLFAFAPEEVRGDALEEVEIRALAKAVNDAAMANMPLYNALDAILRGGQGGIVNLVIVVGCIVGRRLLRHGLIPIGDPAEFDARLGIMIEATVNPAAIMNMMPMMPQGAENNGAS